VTEQPENQENHANKRRFVQLWNGLSPARKKAALYILRDLKIAIGGSRETTEIANSYRNSLHQNDPERELARGHIRRLLDDNGQYFGLWNAHVVEIISSGGEKRAKITTLGREILESIESRIQRR
jgi:hypothetical protein